MGILEDNTARGADFRASTPQERAQYRAASDNVGQSFHERRVFVELTEDGRRPLVETDRHGAEWVYAYAAERDAGLFEDIQLTTRRGDQLMAEVPKNVGIMWVSGRGSERTALEIRNPVIVSVDELVANMEDPEE